MGCSACGKKYKPASAAAIVPMERRFRVSKVRAQRMARMKSLRSPTSPDESKPVVKDQSLAPNTPEPLVTSPVGELDVTPLGYPKNPMMTPKLKQGETDE